MFIGKCVCGPKEANTLAQIVFPEPTGASIQKHAGPDVWSKL